jgi:hypothetical protein
MPAIESAKENPMLTRLALSTVALWFAAACSASSDPSPASDTSKFIGTWTYEAGSTISLECAGAAAQTIDLSKVPPTGQPGYFTFSPEPGAALHEIDARGCQYEWTVAGDAASATPNETCASFPDGRGGMQIVHLQSGTKSTSDGATMAIDVHFTTDTAGCTATVHGSATKS